MAFSLGISRLRTYLRYRSLTFGLVILAFFAVLSIYAVIAYPYDYVTRIWYDPRAWEDYPRLAKPAWIRLFTRLSELEGTITLDSRSPGAVKIRTMISYAGRPAGVYIRVEQSFDYYYDTLPSQIVMWLFVNSSQPVYVVVRWFKPGGTVVNVSKAVYTSGEHYIDISTERVGLVAEYLRYLVEKLGHKPSYALSGLIALVAAEDKGILSLDTVRPSKGVYRVVLEAESTDINMNVDIKVNVYGTLYGIAGTDHNRRDLFIAVAWGAPLALFFGLLAALLTTISQMVIAALSAWYGGLVDNLLQRVSEVFMVLPFLPVVMMVSLIYKLTIWSLLMVVVALSIWSGTLKTFRAMFLQIKEMPYIEAARAYGATDLRIVMKYMVPKVLPVLVPNIIISTPSFVFLEAVLALMGVSDPTTITWGKVLEEAYSGAALYRGYYHWILAPAVMLALISVAFASIGFTLDKIFNPRLKEM